MFTTTLSRLPLALTLLLLGAAVLGAQPFERIISDTLDERPNCIEHTTDDGYIIAGTQKDIPFG